MQMSVPGFEFLEVSTARRACKQLPSSPRDRHDHAWITHSSQHRDTDTTEDDPSPPRLTQRPNTYPHHQTITWDRKHSERTTNHSSSRISASIHIRQIKKPIDSVKGQRVGKMMKCGVFVRRMNRGRYVNKQVG